MTKAMDLSVIAQIHFFTGKKSMKKQLVKILVLTAVFAGALVYFNISTGQENKQTTVEMTEPSLPLIYFMEGDVCVNELYGYTTEMDPLGVRDSITPVGDNRRIDFRMDTYGNVPDRIICEICTLDGSEVVASEGRVDFIMDGDTAEAEIAVPGQVEEEKEYLMKLTVMRDGEEVYYYTRILQALDWNAEECIAFASEFHEKTYDKNAESYFAKYQSAGGDLSENYAEVNLDSNTSLLMWGKLDVSEIGTPQISVKEITGYYTSIVIDSVVRITKEDGSTINCNVEEDIRLRDSTERMYVLDYERHVEEIFDQDGDFLTDSGQLNLGIRDTDVTYRANETGTVTAFIQAGELWSYDSAANTIVKVFSFRSEDLTDLRSNYNGHEIRIAQVDEVGNIDFFVCGYMNRGRQEGKTGVALYHYDALMHTVEEMTFLESDTSAAMTIATLCSRLYENSQGQIYLLKDDTLFQIDAASGETTTVSVGLNPENVMASESGRYLVWSREGEDSMHVLNMLTGDLYELEESGKKIRPLAFLGEDLVYGIVAEDTGEQIGPENGRTFYSGLKIIDTSEDKKDVLKSYMPSGYLIRDAEEENSALQIQLVHENDGQYVSAGTDTIVNGTRETEEETIVETLSTSGQPDETVLALVKKSTTVKVKKMVPDELLPEEMSEVVLPDTSKEKNYYVYIWGKIRLITWDMAQAMTLANEERGLVLDNGENCLWSRSRSVSRTAFDCSDIDEEDLTANCAVRAFGAMLYSAGIRTSASELLKSGESMKEVLVEELPQAEVYELTGCDAECLLYFVSRGTPVLAMTSADTAVLLNGYDTEKVYYYDFESGAQCQASYSDMDKLLAAGGERYLAYSIAEVE